MNQPPNFFAGVDWASEKHDVWVTGTDGRRLGYKIFAHSGEGLSLLCAWLTSTCRAEPGQIAVGIEVPHGPVVETLLERGFHVYAINPKQLDRFRDRFTMAGAKDDSRDAETMASALRTDMHAFRKLALADPVVIELREWSRMTEDLTAEKTRLANRVREQLWRYYPQMLAVEPDVAAPWLHDLWQAAPTPAKAGRVRETTITRVLKSNRIRRIDVARVLALLRAEPIQVAPGTTEAAVAHITTLIERLRLVESQLRHAHGQLDRLTAALGAPVSESDGTESESQESEPGQLDEQRDAVILNSLPGVGRITLAALLAEGWDALQRRDYSALRALCGVAPVTKRSGKSRVVVRRHACHPRLGNAVYHWARVASQCDAVSKAKYKALRERGHSHGRALRSVADRLLNIACSMLRSRTSFDPLFANEKTAC
jgi:transposase